MKFIRNLIVFFFDMIDHYYHQKKIMVYLSKYKNQIKSFMDIGCHKGKYTDLFLKNLNITEAFLIEPQEHLFNFLKKKYSHETKIKIFNFAVSDENANKKFYLNKHDLTSSLNQLDFNNKFIEYKSILFSSRKEGMISRSITVETLTLNKIFLSNKINKIDLIKIDTEGHELEVLKGSNEIMEKLKFILIEFRNDRVFLNYDGRKIHEFLLKNNFQLVKIFKFPFTKWEDRFYIRS